MISRGIEISITRGVGEMVRGLSPRPFCFSSLFFFFFYIMYSLLWYKNSQAALAMA